MKKNNTAKDNTKLWGKAMIIGPSALMLKYTSGRDTQSLPAADEALISYDLAGSMAHVKMLAKQKIISTGDAKTLLDGLEEINILHQQGKFKLKNEMEDVHTNVEIWLTKKLGAEKAGKLHTARSRNDQVALDMKLYLKDKALEFISNISLLEFSLKKEAKKHGNTIMPGFTHHQYATPTTFGHILKGYAVMLSRDKKRFANWINLHDQCPLGSAAGYGTTLPIDRKLTAKLLGFSQVSQNSMDDVTTRWEAEADLAYVITLLLQHLSSLAETLIILSMPGINFLKLDEAFVTGSSLMPQKKNPDPLEVTKAKANLVAGNLQSLLGIGRSAFLGYNRDSQWTKYEIMDAVRESIDAPLIFKGIIETLKVETGTMMTASKQGFLGATALVEQLASEKNLPFRRAKQLVELAIKYSEGKNIVSWAAFQKSARECGLRLRVSEKQLADWQNPCLILQKIKSYGGPRIRGVRPGKRKAV
jgi:argininosuccinate lyase